MTSSSLHAQSEMLRDATAVKLWSHLMAVSLLSRDGRSWLDCSFIISHDSSQLSSAV